MTNCKVVTWRSLWSQGTHSYVMSPPSLTPQTRFINLHLTEKKAEAQREWLALQPTVEVLQSEAYDDAAKSGAPDCCWGKHRLATQCFNWRSPSRAFWSPQLVTWMENLFFNDPPHTVKDHHDLREYGAWRGLPDGALLLLFRTDGEGKVTVEPKEWRNAKQSQHLWVWNALTGQLPSAFSCCLSFISLCANVRDILICWRQNQMPEKKGKNISVDICESHTLC